MIRKLYKLSYTVGSVMVILSMLLSFVPAFPAMAQQGGGNSGSIKTNTGSCGSPVNKNHYDVGDMMNIHFENFAPNSSVNWSITGQNNSCDAGSTVASGTVTVDGNGDACVQAYTIQAGDCGNYKSTAGNKSDHFDVTGSAPQEEEEPDANPSFSVSKSPNPSEVMVPGAPVTYSIMITNTGDQDLVLTSLSDDKTGDIGTCAALVGETLSIDQTLTCSFAYWVSGVGNTDHVNVFTVQASDGETTLTRTAQASVHINPRPHINATVVKTANPTAVQEPGSIVEFTVQVTNIGEVDFEIVSLVDNIYGDLNGQGTCSVGAFLAANGGTYSCSFTGYVGGSAGDVHTNTVRVSVNSEYGPAGKEGSATVNIVEQLTELGVSVSKSANPTSVMEPGGDVTFTFTVANTSEVDVQLFSLTDNVFGDLNGQGTCVTGGTIPVGGSYSCTLTTYIDGPHTNTVTGTISYEGQQLYDTGMASVEYVSLPVLSISVIKSASPSMILGDGGNVTFDVSVENNSETSVDISSILDSVFVNDIGTCVPGVSIASGGTYNCSFTKYVSGDSDTPHNNTISVQVVDEYQQTAEGSDDATVSFEPEPEPEIMLVDPCTVGCDMPNVVALLCNGDLENDYIGEINWTFYVGETAIGSGTLQGVSAGECAELSVPRAGDGLYSIIAVLADEDNREIVTSCGPLSCTVDPRPTPTPIPPVTPPSETPTGVFFPETGLDLSSNSLISKMQNFGFALISLGLVLHGFSLNEKKPKKSKK